MRTWTCDECGEPINGEKNGWLEWYSYHPGPKAGEVRGYGLRIVHHAIASPRKPKGNCYYDRTPSGVTVNDNHLDRYLGSNGLMRLLAMIYDKVVPTNEILEVIKRLHIPDYEEARQHFDAAIAAGVYEPNTAPGFPHEGDIKAVCRFAKDQSDD